MQDDFTDTEYQVIGTSNNLENGRCSCGGIEFSVDEACKSISAITFTDGKPKYMGRENCMQYVEIQTYIHAKSVEKSMSLLIL